MARGADFSISPQDQLVTDTSILRELVADYNLPLVPVVALRDAGSSSGEFEAIGLREKSVVRARVHGRTISLQRMGSMVGAGDRRLDGIETSVMGSRLLLAYEDPTGELVGLVGTSGGYYFVHRLGNKALAISRLSVSGD